LLCGAPVCLDYSRSLLLVDSAEAVGLAAIPLLRLVSLSCHEHSFFRRVTPFEPAVRLV
jgi:hypothetical protein